MITLFVKVEKTPVMSTWVTNTFQGYKEQSVMKAKMNSKLVQVHEPGNKNSKFET